jgi:hypothetical protein
VRLYPKRFRDDFGPDLVQLVADQLDDEPTWRVATRSAVDLALTIPARHLEARMHRSSTPVVPLLFAALAVASLVAAATASSPIVLLVSCGVGIAAGSLGLVAALRARALTAPVPLSAHWWKVLGGGAALLTALFVVTGVLGDLPDGGWMVAMTTGLAALLLMAAGLALGVAHLLTRPVRRTLA